MTRYSSTMSEALKKMRNSVSERELTDAEEKRREEIAKDLPDQEFKDRYGARWKSVKIATATKMVKKESLNEGVRWKVKIEGLPPVYMDAGSASEVRTQLRKLVKQPDMIQDIDRVTDTQMKKDLRKRLAGKDKEEIEEARERPARQLLNPNKEEMVVKKNEVIVIDKKDLDKYLKRGWALAEEVELDEEVADLFVKDKVGSDHQIQIALKIKGLAKKLGLRTGSVGNQVRVMGPKKTVTQFMRSILGKSSLGNPSEVGASNSQTDRELKKQLKEEGAIVAPGSGSIAKPKKAKSSDVNKSIEQQMADARKEEVEIDEGRMKELSMYIGQGKSAEWIAKKMKLDVKTVKALMSEENELDEKTTHTFGVEFQVDAPDEKPIRTGREPHVKIINKLVKKHKLLPDHADDLSKFNVKDEVGGRDITRFFNDMAKAGLDVIKKKITDNYKSRTMGEEEQEVEESKLIDKQTGDVLKTGSKEEMETERKRNRDELQVKEWFESKGIDVTTRKLDDATQAYVKLGKIIPNEIREGLIKIQYGKLPEDIKNMDNIVYGNFKENSITMNNEFWKKVFEARQDDPSQEQDTNIIMQLRKSVSLRGMKDVEFDDGKKVKVKPKIATAVMDKFNSYRTTDEKLKFQQKIAKSYKDLLSALKEK